MPFSKILSTRLSPGNISHLSTHTSIPLSNNLSAKGITKCLSSLAWLMNTIGCFEFMASPDYRCIMNHPTMIIQTSAIFPWAGCYTDVQIISCGMVLYRKYDTDSNSSTTPPSSQMPRRLQSPGPATNALIQRAGPVAASRPRRSARPSRSPPRGCASGDSAAQEHEATGDALDGPHLLRKRALIESMNDQLKNISQIEHSRHRSVINFFVNLFAGLIAHSLRPKKPSLNLLAATCRSLTSNSR